jgi:DNA-binding MarR family transcriptional regulator
MNKPTFEPMMHPGHLVRRLHQICVSVFLSDTADIGITHIQYSALLAVEYAPGIDQVSLGKLIAADRQTVSVVVNRLCERGLMEKRRKDKRTNALFLTLDAKAVMKRMLVFVHGVDEAILAPLSLRERDVFMKLLGKLVAENNELSRAPQGRAAQAH